MSWYIRYLPPLNYDYTYTKILSINIIIMGCSTIRPLWLLFLEECGHTNLLVLSGKSGMEKSFLTEKT
jgi:hypothetical protein